MGVKLDPTKLYKLRDDWVRKNAEANRYIAELNQETTRFNSTDANDPMSKNGSVFRADSENGAFAATNSSSTVTNNTQNVNNDPTAQQIPTAPNTLANASGPTATASALQNAEQGGNQGKRQDYTNAQKEEAQARVKESRDKYMSYLSEALSYNPEEYISSSNVFDIASNTNGENDVAMNTANKPATETVDKYDASDQTKTDKAYKEPDANNDTGQKTVDQELLEQQELIAKARADERAQLALEQEYDKMFTSEEQQVA